ncbi:SAF domain-containing protein [Archangium gephyra]|uniref:SAF domain-containing protein n=1 Tax=Archangium gephyra TaxID=48 RepID=UPI0035D45B70
MRSFLLGALIGLIVSCAAVGLFVAHTTSKRLREFRSYWEPTPALALTRDIAEAERLQEGDLVEIRLPAQYASESFIPPADKSVVIGKATSLAMVKGDVASWSLFSQLEGQRQVRACVADARAAYTAAGEQARDAALEAFSRRSGPPPTSPPPPVPALKFDAKGLTPVVVVTQAVEQGEPIPASALEVRRMPRALTTPSLVPGDALASVAGALAVVALQPGDALRWQFLDDPEQPRTMGTCMVQAASAVGTRHATVANARAEAFFGVAREGR